MTSEQLESYEDVLSATPSTEQCCKRDKIQGIESQLDSWAHLSGFSNWKEDEPKSCAWKPSTGHGIEFRETHTHYECDTGQPFLKSKPPLLVATKDFIEEFDSGSD